MFRLWHFCECVRVCVCACVCPSLQGHACNMPHAACHTISFTCFISHFYILQYLHLRKKCKSLHTHTQSTIIITCMYICVCVCVCSYNGRHFAGPLAGIALNEILFYTLFSFSFNTYSYFAVSFPLIHSFSLSLYRWVVNDASQNLFINGFLISGNNHPIDTNFSPPSLLMLVDVSALRKIINKYVHYEKNIYIHISFFV